MPKYIIEREMPGVGQLSAAKLRTISQNSCGVFNEIGPQIQWLESYVTNDKFYSVLIAKNEQLLRQHARQTGFPATKISIAAACIGPNTFVNPATVSTVAVIP